MSELVQRSLRCDPVDIVDWRLVSHVIFVGGIVSGLIAFWRQEIVVEFVQPLQLQESCV